MYEYSDLEDQIDSLKNALKFFKDNMEYGYDKTNLQKSIDALSALERDLIYFIDEYERVKKQEYAMECSNDHLYMLEAVSW